MIWDAPVQSANAKTIYKAVKRVTNQYIELHDSEHNAYQNKEGFHGGRFLDMLCLKF